MDPQPGLPHHPSSLRLRRMLRWGLLALALLPALAYFVYLHGDGSFGLHKDVLFISLPGYRWRWGLLPQLFAQWGGALLLLVLAAGLWDRRWPLAHKTAVRFVLTYAALAVAGYLGAIQFWRVPTLDPFLLQLVLVAAGFASYLLVRAIKPASALAEPNSLERHRRQLVLLLTLAGVLVGLTSWQIIYSGHPIVTDSQSQIAQARLLLAGHWRLEVAQPLRDVISFPYAIPTVPSYSQYPPGYILTLVPLLAVGLPAQSLDFLYAGLAVALTFLLTRRMAGPRAALAAAVLLACSPFFLGMSGSGMNHTLAMMMLTAAAFGLMPVGPARSPRALAALRFIGGLALGWAVVTRPLTGFAHAAVWGVAWLELFVRAWLGRTKKMADCTKNFSCRTKKQSERTTMALLVQALWVALGLAIPALIFMFYNYKTTGHPLRMGYEVSNPAMHRLGFINDGPYKFTPMDALHHLAANLLSLNTLLFGWAVGSWVLLGVWWLRTRLSRGELILIAIIAFQTLLYSVYNFHDLFMGPRFMFELTPMLAILGGLGLGSLLNRRGLRAAVLWCVIALMSLGGLLEGYDFWQRKFGQIVKRHDQLDSFMRAVLPLREPTVIVLDKEDAEMVGRYFAQPPGRPALWFVLDTQYEAARRRPELAGCRWYAYPMGYELSDHPLGLSAR